MTDPTRFDWKKYITDCLSSTKYFSLATVDEKGVWSNPVFFAWDNEFNFYFISQMKSRHMQNLKKDTSVAVSIYSTEQKGSVAGIQIQGHGIILEDEKDIRKAYAVYSERAGKKRKVEEYITNPVWTFVKIIPENFSYFDTRFFDEERQTVSLKELTA